MPIGARTGGLASGPGGQAPRLFAELGDQVGGPGGLTFVPLGHDTTSLRTNPADVTGIVVATFGPVASDQVVLVERMTIASESTAPTTMTAYLGTVDAGNIVDASSNGNGDVADEVQPILVPGGQSLIFRWVGMSGGARGFVRLQFRFGAYQQGA